MKRVMDMVTHWTGKESSKTHLRRVNPVLDYSNCVEYYGRYLKRLSNQAQEVVGEITKVTQRPSEQSKPSPPMCKNKPKSSTASTTSAFKLALAQRGHCVRHLFSAAWAGAGTCQS